MTGASDEMVEGYLDGRGDVRVDVPAQSNRSKAYLHGWQNGRDDRLGLPRAAASDLKAEAEEIIAAHPTPPTQEQART